MDDLETMLRAGRVEEALTLAEAIAERSATAETLRDLARARLRAQRPMGAVDAVERGLRADHEREYEPELLTLLADAYERLGELQRADNLCTRALRQLAKTDQGVVSRNAHTFFPHLIRCQVAMARVSERRGQLLRAAYLLEGVQIQARVAGNPKFCPSEEDASQNARFWSEIAHLIHLHRGRVALALADMPLASTELEAALNDALTQSDTETIVLAHVQLGRLAAEEQHPDAALRHFLEGVRWHETGQATVRDDELRAAVRSSREELYAGAIDSAFAADDYLTACRRVSRHERVCFSRESAEATPRPCLTGSPPSNPLPGHLNQTRAYWSSLLPARGCTPSCSARTASTWQTYQSRHQS